MKSLTSVEHAFGSNVIFASTKIDLPERGVVALRGSNGSGKTTLLKLLGGVIHSSCGTVRDWRNRFNAVYLDTEYLTLDYLTASELLDMIRPLTGPIPDNGLLTDGMLATKVSDLSLGQRQRLVLTAALAFQHTDVVLLDEPLNGLDRDGSKAARSALLAAGQDRLVILATHEEDRWTDYDLTIGQDRKVRLSEAGVAA
ncbi:ABC-type multidrug transport system ATPase subunit [Paenarthrobacter nicotinovorans]|jgi:ABC-type multidrug transport system ATPase subunit|uniref:ABC-type multidrug transport system ATPase subunit n=1 Tax=Paenarthrobacter nicotinovorans TaxID=29320 RepID=A0ABT9TME3_PAENI|nr:ATP-binding cassette domain-containing protein [Paenarthrobacter nicotinovorans]MDQ0102832.1 ABC-type multidrug transport system ATPase subunit [Paenarthrobacter nicotinovorans]GAT87261.1 ABC transporter-like protein [Paenarthrobacter nicotinovorans]